MTSTQQEQIVRVGDHVMVRSHEVGVAMWVAKVTYMWVKKDGIVWMHARWVGVGEGVTWKWVE